MSKVNVAPRTGAWIETSNGKLVKVADVSPLAQGRGLKLDSFNELIIPFSRPSHRGVD